MAEYSINDIFYSIQGEGFLTGTSAVFVRFAGCNLRCRWCDTSYNHKEFLDHLGILKKVSEFCTDEDNKPMVILTGGEPTLQDLKPLLSTLHLNHFRVQIETNGTSLIYPYLPTISPIITVSPKSPDYIQRVGHELKLVYTGQTENALKEYMSQSHFNRYSLQPLWIERGMSNLDDTVAMVKKLVKWELSIQVHKLIGGK